MSIQSRVCFSDYYLKTSDYLEKHDRQYVQDLQDYVSENKVDGTDQSSLYEWELQNNQVMFMVYNLKEEITYLSYNRGTEVYQTSISFEFWDLMKVYEIRFRDGVYYAAFFGTYAYQPYVYCNIGSFIIAFVFLLGICLYGIRKKVRYIQTIQEEIEIMGGGDLNLEVTRQGRDELTDLAENLDQMRLSLRHHMEEEERLTKERGNMITRLSHDIRTPLTSMSLFAELLQKEKFKDEAQKNHYIDRIHENAVLLTELTDQLQQYTCADEKHEKYTAVVEQSVPEKTGRTLLEETSEYLQLSGFHVHKDFGRDFQDIPLDELTCRRVFENIASNIVKYADRDQPVHISCRQTEEEIQITFRNGYRSAAASDPEGTGIGVKNIREMVERAGGKVIIYQEEEYYEIEIVFPGNPGSGSNV